MSNEAKAQNNIARTTGRNNTDTDTGQKYTLTPPSLSLPEGGGAIRGIGEKFSANPVTGTGSLSVPIFTSPPRSGFGPQLSLSYDSGSGNGPFGFGWTLSLPSITRKTDKGLPRYQGGEESDVFILSGSEDLVPVFKKDSNGNLIRDTNGDYVLDEYERDGYVVRRYRPRIEGLFARIERWTRKVDGDIHWRSISKDNTFTVYGRDEQSRIADPNDKTHRIFSWLICESYDDKGSAILYEYIAENDKGISLSQANERNRTRTANRYIKRIWYGNPQPLLLDINKPSFRKSHLKQTDFSSAGWMFEVVFDYGGEGHYTMLPIDKTRPEAEQHRYVQASSCVSKSSVGDVDNSSTWFVRPDPFSNYRAGFEIRTYRRCQRVLMFHSFPELGSEPYLVSSTEFNYSDFDYFKQKQESVIEVKAELEHQGSTRFASFIRAVTQSGYVRDESRPVRVVNNIKYPTYLKKSPPPLEFEYSKAVIHEEIKEIDSKSIENLPYGLDDVNYQFVDVDGEGISGILTEQAEAWFYKPNLGEGKFGPLQRVTAKPSLAAERSGRRQFLDLAGDGKLDVVQLDSSAVSGFYERKPEDKSWENFTPFALIPNISWNDPNLRFIDLTGDGHADIFITKDDQVFTWYPSLAEEGFGPAAYMVHQALNEEKEPCLAFADATQSIYLADMSGDGLTDLVRIRNGEVCYWPNLGYGRFGTKVTMDNAPWFDTPDQFNQRRIRLADIDGSGVTDILYLSARNGVQIYFNQSGNRWSKAYTTYNFPHIDNLLSIQVADLLGTGTACLIWSSPLPSDFSRHMRYIDFMDGEKPHLIVSSKNNLGAETRVHYASSTKFYIADKIAGKPWITRVPFSVNVVERVETYDHISRNRFITHYAYHHGYFDGAEREFRGFGMVEQWDTEEFDAFQKTGDEHPPLPPSANIEEYSHVPPVLTKTWFHTGAYVDAEHISGQFEQDYYREPELDDAQFQAQLLPDTILPSGLTHQEEHEACRALKGSVLRREVYALDKTPKSEHPYTVSEHNYTIKLLQPRAEGNRHAIFFVHSSETINYHYERNLSDPRVNHELTLAVDDFGKVLRSAAIGYGRRQPDTTLTPNDRLKQTNILITCVENRYTNSIDQEDAYRTPLIYKSSTFEMTGLVISVARKVFDFVTVDNAVRGATQISYELAPSDGLQKRLIDCKCILYRKNDLTGQLPVGRLESLALPFESYQLAFTPGLIMQVYGNKVTDAMLSDEGGYVHLTGDASVDTNDNSSWWWAPSGQIFYSPDSSHISQQELEFARTHFFLPHRIQDPFEQNTKLTYDKYALLLQETRDPLDNVTRAENDYRVLQPRLVTDPNGNRSEVAFDALGMVVGAAVMGKVGENKGDSLDGFVADLDEATIVSHIQDPLANPQDILGKATSRFIYDLNQYMHSAANSNPLPSVVYAIVRETHNADLAQGQQTKIQHSLSHSDGFGREIQRKVQAEPGNIAGVMTDPRWVGSGWTIFNNKGKPVRQYEPFFSSTHTFEFAKEVGVSSTLFYDPLERVVGTLHPNHTYEKVVFDAWHQEKWDVNDTVLQDPKADPDIGDWFSRLREMDYLPTWYDSRKDRQLGRIERVAAEKASQHAGTPSIQHLDTLERVFVTIEDNIDEEYLARIELDIEGNQRSVTDTLGRLVMIYDYNLLGDLIHQSSMDAGQRWMLMDVTGVPIYSLDSRNHTIRTKYDQLRRPVEVYLKEGTASEKLVEHILYGEAEGDAKNHRGKVYKYFDGAGVVTNEEYDFKGRLLRSSRQLAADYKNVLDWSSDPKPSLEEEQVFTTVIEHDALNRPDKVIYHDRSIVHFIYNEAHLLEGIEANLHGAADVTAFVRDIRYNAKGQRELIEYGNGVKTSYEYDHETFRLIHMQTIRDSEHLQNLSYTYDPVGNITHIQDNADIQNVIFFRHQRVEPSADYTYDALYRLVKAMGREHLGQTNTGALRPPSPTSHTDEPHVNLHDPNDGNAIGIYSESYEYDRAGNILKMIHVGTDPSHPGWTRSYHYQEDNLLESAFENNRLSYTRTDKVMEPYTYDAHGNTTSMPHLHLMKWDYLDRLCATSTQKVNSGGTPETTYYVYDTSGQRIRKVTERYAAEGTIPTREKERIYLGGFEIYRRYGSDVSIVTLERETLHIMDDNQRIALIETRTQGNDDSPEQLIRYQLRNHLDCASLELDPDAQIISYEEYYPYGSTSYQAVRSQTETSKRYRYTSKERDEESGLYYHGARYYAPWLGKWISCDPAGLVDGPNLYRYSRNSPIVFTDPSGMQPPDPSSSLTLEEFIATAPSPYSVEYLEGVWNAAHPPSSANDIVGSIAEIEKPGDVAEFWATQARPNRAQWSHSLSEIEEGYIQAFTDPSVPGAIQMRSPVDPSNLTSEEQAAATRLFGRGANAANQYANYENRRRIMAHYVLTHPATVNLQLGLYRLFRDINPIHFALERGWQIGGGREMFTQQEVSRLGAAAEFFAGLAIGYGVTRVLRAVRPSAQFEAPFGPQRPLTDPIWDLPAEGGGMRINGRWYTEHALERMAPNTPQVQGQLATRVRARLERTGFGPGHPAYDRIMARAMQRIDPRGVPPSVVEAEIAKPGSTNVRVVTARRGQVVVTVMRR